MDTVGTFPGSRTSLDAETRVDMLVAGTVEELDLYPKSGKRDSTEVTDLQPHRLQI